MSSPADTSTPAQAAGAREQRHPTDAPAADDAPQRFAPAADVPTPPPGAPAEVQELAQEAELVREKKSLV